MRAALYTRVSTATRGRHGDTLAYDQNPEVQQDILREAAKARGWEVHAVYVDRASGAKEARPGLAQAMADARRRRFDVLMLFKFDRLSRSVRHFLQVVEELRAAGVGLYSHEQALDTTTPMGQFTLTMFAALAELERGVIRERVIAGLDYAKRHGTKSGMAIGRPRAVFRRDKVRELRDQGLSWREIAQTLGATVGTVRRAYKDANGAVAPCQNPCGATP